MKSICLKHFLAPVCLLAIFMVSCKKDGGNKTEDPEMNNALQASADNEIVSSQFNDVFSISLGVQSSDAGEDIGLGTGQGILYRPGGNASTLGEQCFTVTVTPKVAGEWPKTVTFDFGDGCEGKDGKVRKGKIISIFTAPAYEPGAKVTTSFEGYHVDSFSITGTHAIENTSADNKIGFIIEIEDGKVTNTNSGYYHMLSGSWSFLQNEGMSTPFNLWDDQYQITGGASGGNASGLSWNTEITSPVMRKFDCRWRVKGVVSIHWNQNPDGATLDYGDGACDNKAKVSYLGYSKIISL